MTPQKIVGNLRNFADTLSPHYNLFPNSDGGHQNQIVLPKDEGELLNSIVIQKSKSAIANSSSHQENIADRIVSPSTTAASVTSNPSPPASDVYDVDKSGESGLLLLTIQDAWEIVYTK